MATEKEILVALTPYPEHAKLRAVRERHETVCEFLAWLDETKGINLAWREPSNYSFIRFDELVAEFFEIDMNAFEAEKRAMVDRIREQADEEAK